MNAMVDLEQYQKLALDLLQDELGSFVADVEVKEGLDYDEQPALFFEAVLDNTAPSDLGRAFIFSHLHLRRALEDRQEFRFPYLATRRPGGSGAPDDVILKSSGSASVAKRRVTR
jgi:hypothetical protein